MGTPPGTTNTWGKRSTRVLAIAPGAVLMVALAGCSLGNPTLNEPAPLPANEADAGPQPPTASSDERPAFHFASGDLILGDFTYEDVAGNIFNPCEEISAEEFAAIGFETDGDVKRSHTKDVTACVVEPIGGFEGLEFAVMGGSANLANTVEQGALVETGISSVLPQAYSYGPIGIEADLCYAAVDTLRGQLSVGVGGFHNASTQQERCDKALAFLEDLYRNQKISGE